MSRRKRNQSPPASGGISFPLMTASAYEAISAAPAERRVANHHVNVTTSSQTPTQVMTTRGERRLRGAYGEKAAIFLVAGMLPNRRRPVLTISASWRDMF